MFDHLGGSWPKHSCFDTEYRRLEATVLPAIKAGADPATAMFKPFADLKAKLGSMPLADRTKSAENAHPPKSASQRKNIEHSIKKMDPMDGEQLSFIGVIRERTQGTARIANLYKSLGDVGRKLFGLPAQSKAVQLTVVDANGEPHESYSGIGDGSKLEPGLDSGVMVWVTMLGQVKAGVSAWVIIEINAL